MRSKGAAAGRKYQLHYQQCPWGLPDIEVLESDERPVGVAAVQPRPMSHAGRAVRAGLLIDFAS